MTAQASGSPGPFSELAVQVQEVTGAACVVLVIFAAAGNGGYNIAGALEAHFIMPPTLERVAIQLPYNLLAQQYSGDPGAVSVSDDEPLPNHDDYSGYRSFKR